MSSSSSTICWTAYFFSTELPLLLCQRSNDYIFVGLLTDFWILNQSALNFWSWCVILYIYIFYNIYVYIIYCWIQFLNSVENFLSFFLAMPVSGMQDLSSLTRDRTWLHAAEALSPNHWTVREFPCWGFFSSMFMRAIGL